LSVPEHAEPQDSIDGSSVTGPAAGMAVEDDGIIRRRAAVNTASNVGGTVFALALWFFMTPFILHRVGGANYGLWILITSLVGYGALLDLGVASAVTRYVAVYRRHGDAEGMQGVVSAGLAVFSATGLAVLIASMALAPFVPGFFDISKSQESTATWLVVFAGLAVAVTLPTALTLAVLRGLQRFDLVNIIGTVGTLLTAGVIVAILEFGGGVVAITAVQAPLELLMQIPMVLAIRRTDPALRFHFRSVNRDVIRRIASFGVAQSLIRVSVDARTKGPEVVIGALLPVARVTPYSVSRRFSNMASMVSEQLVAVLIPLASELHAGGESVRLRAVQAASTRVATAVFLFVACPAAVLAKPFLAAWVGPAYSDPKLVYILLGAGLAATLAWPSLAVLTAMGRNRALALFTIGSAVMSICLAVLLVGSIGLTGAALAVLVATASESLGVAIPYSMRITGIDAGTLVRSSIIPAFLPAIPSLAVLYALRELLQPDSLVTVLGVASIGGAVYAVAYLALDATAAEREPLRALAAHAGRSLRRRSSSDDVAAE
jgi:O-antigen/teichoic acid export membrane protein